MVDAKSPNASLWQATRHISGSLRNRQEHDGFMIAAAQLRRVLYEGTITAVADFGLGPLGWTPDNTVPSGSSEFNFNDVVCPGTKYERREVPAAMWDETEILWSSSLVWRATIEGVEIYKMVKILKTDLERFWPRAGLRKSKKHHRLRQRRGPKPNGLRMRAQLHEVRPTEVPGKSKKKRAQRQTPLTRKMILSKTTDSKSVRSEVASLTSPARAPPGPKSNGPKMRAKLQELLARGASYKTKKAAYDSVIDALKSPGGADGVMGRSLHFVLTSWLIPKAKRSRIFEISKSGFWNFA
jgi:hypothetical protein